MTTDNDRIRQLEQELTRLRMQSVPAAERPLYERELRVQEQERAMSAQRQELNQAARIIKAHEISQKTGADPDELLKHDDMEQAGIDHVAGILSDPAKAQAYVDFLKRAAPQDGTKTPETPTAPNGSDQAPAGPGGPSGGTSTPGPDPQVAILEKFKGTGKLSDYLAAVRQATPATTVVFGGVPQASDINYQQPSAAGQGNLEQNPPPSGGDGKSANQSITPPAGQSAA